MSQTPRLLHGHPRQTSAASFQALAAYCEEHDLQGDVYGASEWLQSFEAEIADLLGKEAALFFPSGTMAQQIALRIWADRKKSAKVAFHATSHLEAHEQHGYRHLHRLEAQLVGETLRTPSREDIAQLDPDVSALLLELPMREIGGQLIPWDELSAIREWSRNTGVALHLDGARLYEAAAGYGRSVTEVASLFDSAYVSFYKGIGGLAGAALAGPRDFIEEARPWLRRHGGNLVQMTPFTVSARIGMETRLDRFRDYVARAKEIGALLESRYGAVRSGAAGADLATEEARPGRRIGLTVMPSPVQVNMMHLLFGGTPEGLNSRREQAGAETGLLPCARIREDMWGRGTMTELYVGEAALEESDDTIAASFDVLLG
ncbi:MAG: beta-eliminating lyase-related protein [Candidatus Eisenbacteria bacterium]